tara:strand:+ start:12377 stop:14476 length:2100 start_codon:yes stop_codon:yes gene_type:complete
MWILPSRGRPASLKRFFNAYHTTGANSCGVVCLDNDDTTLDEYLKIELPTHWWLDIAAPIGLGVRCNAAFNKHPEEPWYGLISDDVVPRTGRWDQILIHSAGNYGMAYGSDGLVNEAQFTHGVLGGDLVRELGWIILPGLQRLYGDNVLTAIGKEKGIMRYCPYVLLEHLHFSNGKSPMDKTYEKPEASEDRRIYKAWADGRRGSFVICCVQAGNYLGRGAEYVNKLYDMVLRNMPPDVPWRFQCFTDDPRGLDPRIEPWALWGDLKGWDNKIRLFKSGTFSGGERVIYFDLDTLITGPLDTLLDYRGDFATLRDFWRAEGLGPAVMLWKGGYGAEIWDEFTYAKRPSLPRGDQEWLENYFFAHDGALYPHRTRFTTKRPDILQDLYPSMFASYKTHCNPYPPNGASVICFHGLPRPHEVEQKWVKDVWKIGGASALQLSLDTNTSTDLLLANIKTNAVRNIPWIKMVEPHDGHAVIVGSAPSLLKNIDSPDGVRWRHSLGQTIFALNNAASILAFDGINPDYHVILDARESNVKFMGHAKEYLIAAQCHPSLFKFSANITGWVPGMEGATDNLPNGQWQLIGGGVTVGISALWVAYVMGYRNLHLYGFDSSYLDGQTHAAAQERTSAESMDFDVNIGEQTFRTNAVMAKQAEIFPSHAAELANLGCIITVHGKGLLPAIAKHMQYQQYQSDQSQLLEA